MISIAVIIQQGYSVVEDESKFREWARKWLPGIADHSMSGTEICWDVPLEVWAFRARKMATDQHLWSTAWIAIMPRPCFVGWEEYCAFADPGEWIIAACVALETQRRLA